MDDVSIVRRPLQKLNVHAMNGGSQQHAAIFEV
jgi:hypothetical protein